MSQQIVFLGGFVLGVGAFATFHFMVVAEWRNRVKALRATVFGLDEKVVDLKNQLHPTQWADDPDTNMKVKERLYDQYPDLVRPGTEVIYLIDEDDVPNE